MQDAPKDLFKQLKEELQNFDPVYFCERYLTLDGRPFKLTDSGYRPFCDIYRYIGIKALEPNSKPMILVKSRQTGGTTMALALEMYFVGSRLFGGGQRPPMRIIHTFPQLEHAYAYSKTKLNTMINASVPVETKLSKKNTVQKSYMQSMLDTTTASNDSLQFKQFIGGNHLWVESSGLTGDRLRGRTADCLFIDECQDTTAAAIANCSKILTASSYGAPGRGIQTLFGTPKQFGSDFHKMWLASSQQYYYLGCEQCKKHFPLYIPGSDEWEQIWLHDFIVQCTHCGHQQDKRPAAQRGKWIATKDINEPDCQLVGFHINQLYMPNFSKEDILSQKPGVHPVNSERAYRNETLGEFYNGDSSPITPEEIREMCGLPEVKMKARITPGQEQIVVLGLDYGSRNDLEALANPDKSAQGGKSYSSAVVLSVKGPSLFHVEFATKFKRNDLASKKSLIDQIMRQYSVQLAIGDIGYSNDLSGELHISYGDRYLASRAQNKIASPIKAKFNTDSFPKEVAFERDFYIGEMLGLLKKGNVKFPLGDYEKVAWLISHCSSMDIKPSISRAGEASIHYVKGSAPNDGFMALLNAYLAFKFLITKGFTSLNPLLQQTDLKKQNQPLVVGGYISRRM